MFIPYCPSGPDYTSSDEQWEFISFQFYIKITAIVSKLNRVIPGWFRLKTVLSKMFQIQFVTCRENNDQFYKYYFDNLVIGGLKRDLERKIFSRAVNWSRIEMQNVFKCHHAERARQKWSDFQNISAAGRNNLTIYCSKMNPFQIG